MSAQDSRLARTARYLENNHHDGVVAFNFGQNIETHSTTNRPVGLSDGACDSTHSWKELLLDLKPRGPAMVPDLAGAGAEGRWQTSAWMHGKYYCGHRIPADKLPQRGIDRFDSYNVPPVHDEFRRAPDGKKFPLLPSAVAGFVRPSPLRWRLWHASVPHPKGTE